MENIIVTPRSLSKGNNPLLARIKDAGYNLVFPNPGKQPTEDELVEVIGDAVGYIAGVEPITAAVLEKAEKLKVISRNGTGIDNIDLETARKKNIKIRKADGANARGVAELTIGLILAAVRDIVLSDRSLKSGIWNREKGFELEDKTLGIIGCGKIGQLVSRFALEFGMNVLAYDAYPNPDFHPSGNFRFDALRAVLKNSDIVSLHCPPLPDKRPLIEAAEIATMKHGAIIINTARQSLVDEKALLEALDSGILHCYAIDAFDKEPPDDLSLAKNERVIVTPHIGGFTEESIQRATEAAIDNLLESLQEA
ncbi:MAG: phosphoglycerate dehydrogenase [Rectinema sp.]|jgi:phosphoglycerate dehydrogenase-like enzyme|uniref:D-isomer specific 2-hydroxyacid dehydrogenase, NAD-binding protein n=1 Tax=uncultured spirochete TaxID=156406 RepID=A0A3P3XNX7_9SPIR|nr:D-isomer specific 2-hydroxyacid dehydrogenase, NAD-binding protein [uncultured spirochete]